MAVMKRTRARDGATLYYAQFIGPDGIKKTERVATLKRSATQKEHRAAVNKARSRADDRHVEVENGTWVDQHRTKRGSAITFGELLDEFLMTYRSSTGRIDDYLSREKLFRTHFGTLRVDRITVQDVERFRNARLADHAPETVKKELRRLAKVFKWGLSAGLVTSNPASADVVERPRVPRYKARALSPDEERRLVAACEPWLALPVRWMLGTGMDRGEVLALRERSVSDAMGHVDAPRSKTNTPRTIPLNATLREVLAASRTRRDAFAKLRPTPLRDDKEAREAMAGDEFVFVNESGGRLTVPNFRKALVRAYRRAGIPAVNPSKILRHTFASRLLARGVPPSVVARLMGHTTVGLLDTYGHFTADDLRAGMVALDPQTATAAATL